MGQDTTGTSLTTTAAAAGQFPTYQFWVDWGHETGTEVGWVADGGFAGQWTNESAYVVDMRGDMNSTNLYSSPAALGNGVVSSATVTLNNATFRFSPSNTTGALYDHIKNGGIHMKRAVIRAGYYSSTELLTNGGFETAGGGGADVFGTWTEVAGDGAIADETVVFHGGAHACKLTCGASTNTSIHQHVTVVPGNVYLLTFWGRVATGDGEGLCKVYDDTNAADIVALGGTGLDSTAYTQLSKTFTAPAGCVSVSIHLAPNALNGDIVYFDDVSLTAYEYTRQITGYIVSARESYAGRTVQLEIRDRGADQAIAKISTGYLDDGSVATERLWENHTSHDYLDHLIAVWNATNPAKDDIAAGDCDFDVGMFVVPERWVTDSTLWAELQKEAECQMGRCWWDKDGDLHVEDGTHWVTPGGDSWDDPTVVQATLSMDFAEVSPEADWSNVTNHVKVQWTPLVSSGTAADVYTLRQTIAIPPNTTIDHRAEMDGSVYTYGANCFSLSAGYPTVPHTHDFNTSAYWAVTAGGVEINDDVDLTLDVYTDFLNVHIANTNLVYTAYLTKLVFNASDPFEDASDESGWYEVEDTTSIAAHGRNTMTISNGYVQSRLHASTIGDFVLARMKDPIQVVHLTGIPARPWLEIGDRIHVQDTAGSGVHEDYLISRIQWQYAPKRGFTQSIDALKIADLWDHDGAYFIIGTSKYGTTGDGGSSHYYFW